MNDLKYACRSLLKKPGFTSVIVITLALGIGANTTIFSCINALLLRPLPFAEPERLVLLWGTNPSRGWPQVPTSQPNFVDLRSQATVLEKVGAWGLGYFNLSGEPAPQRVQYGVVSDGFFSVFGVEPMLGRTFRPEEEQPGAARVVILSHQLWQDRYGGDATVVGKPMILDGQSYEVIGVLPRGYAFATYPKETDVWIPFGADPFSGRRFARGNRSLGVIARLKAGVTKDQAQAELNVISERLEAQHPEFNTGLGVKPVNLHEQAAQNLRPALLVSLVAVGFVLLIACANVANLLLARAAGRQREMAIRAAVGASGAHLLRQGLVESLLLALAGGGAGLLLAFWGMHLATLIPSGTPNFFVPYNLTRHAIGLDRSVLVFTAVLSVGTGLLFGLAPMARALRLNLSASLQERPASAGRGLAERRAGNALVIAEVALSMVLLISAGLLAKSFVRLTEVKPGFQPENLIAFDLNLPASKYAQDAQVASFYSHLLERVHAVPGVDAASLVIFPPLSGRDGSTQFFKEGEPMPGPTEKIHTAWRAVSPAYFSSMGIEVRQGRGFRDQDSAGSQRVAVINETMAARFWPKDNPLGKRIALDFEAMTFFPDRPPEFNLDLGLREIVGIVADVRHSGLQHAPQPEMYVPHSQRPVRDMTLMVRAEPGYAAGLTASIRSEVHRLDKDLPMSNITTMSALVEAAVAQPRSSSVLLGTLAGLAMVLAGIGVYGVISCLVHERTRELGIRLALGARRADVLRLVLRQSGMLIGLGLCLGLAAALIATRWMSHLLFGVDPADFTVYLGMPLVLALVAFLSALLPALRAARVDPMVALREE